MFWAGDIHCLIFAKYQKTACYLFRLCPTTDYSAPRTALSLPSSCMVTQIFSNFTQLTQLKLQIWYLCKWKVVVNIPRYALHSQCHDKSKKFSTRLAHETVKTTWLRYGESPQNRGVPELLSWFWVSAVALMSIFYSPRLNVSRLTSRFLSLFFSRLFWWTSRVSPVPC